MSILHPIQNLCLKRKLFHSEADFQFALAWEIQKCYPTANVRLEYCPAEAPNMHIDIIVEMDNGVFPIELKYKTLKTTTQIDGESFNLRYHGAQDLGKYDFMADLQRIERLRALLPRFNKGYAVMLTNDPSYWNPSTTGNTVGEAFNLYDGTVKTGQMIWAEHTGEGTQKGRTMPITLSGRYEIRWQDFNRVGSGRNGLFRYTIIEVN